MDDRNRYSRTDRYRQQDDFGPSRSRQPQQFQRDDEYQYGENQFGERGNDYRSSSWGGGRSDYQSRSSGSYGQNQSDDYDPLSDYDRAALSSRNTSYRGGQENRTYFRGDDFGGRDFSGGGSRFGASGGGSRYGARSPQMGGYAGLQSDRGSDWSIPPKRYDQDERGFFDRATDEVMSWFGDDDAAVRRRRDHNDHRGRGPKNYERSDERLLEDACERLTRDPYVDATNVSVTCSGSEVTLDGTVPSRSAKRRAEDCIDDISGVKHVQNNLRVVESDNSWSETTRSQDT